MEAAREADPERQVLIDALIESSSARDRLSEIMLERIKLRYKYYLMENIIVPLEDTPDKYICPITKVIMKAPVWIEGDRHAYERWAIKEWYERQQQQRVGQLPFCALNPSSVLSNPSTLPDKDIISNDI